MAQPPPPRPNSAIYEDDAPQRRAGVPYPGTRPRPVPQVHPAPKGAAGGTDTWVIVGPGTGAFADWDEAQHPRGPDGRFGGDGGGDDSGSQPWMDQGAPWSDGGPGSTDPGSYYDNASPYAPLDLSPPWDTARTNEAMLKVDPGPGRPDGKGTVDDPIAVGDDIERAAQLIGEGKHVRLDQPDQVVVLLDKVKELVADAKAKGEKAPEYNLCNVTIPGTNLFCVDDSTEILTASGWKRWDALAVGEDVLTLDHASGLSRWSPLEAVNVFPGEPRLMLSMEGSQHSSLTTMEHRWPIIVRQGSPGQRVRRWTTSGTGFGTAHAIPVAAPRSDWPEPKYSDALVATLAWVWTEGTIVGGKDVRIYQSATVNPGHCDAIRAALTNLYGPERIELRSTYGGAPGWRTSRNDATGMMSFHLNRSASAVLLDQLDDGKVVRPEFLAALSEAQLRLFVDVSILGDGHANKWGQRFLSQRDDRRAKAFEMACALLGIPTRTNTIPDNRPGHAGKSMYCVTLKRLAKMRPVSLTHIVTVHDGVVWCPTTRDGTWLARRDGTVFYTGNCADNMDITRDHMPQLSGVTREGSPAALLRKDPTDAGSEADITRQFREALQAQGIKVTDKVVPASHLRATQNQLDGVKVAGIAGAMRAGKIPEEALFVTRDNYVIDGHHRWAAKIGNDAEDGHIGDVTMPVKVVDMDIGAALDYANAFATEMGIQQKKMAQASDRAVAFARRAAADTILGLGAFSAPQGPPPFAA